MPCSFRTTGVSRRRLTVNLGLRYELTTVVQADNNLLGNFIPGEGMSQVGSPQLPNIINGDHKDFRASRRVRLGYRREW